MKKTLLFLIRTLIMTMITMYLYFMHGMNLLEMISIDIGIAVYGILMGVDGILSGQETIYESNKYFRSFR